jgi:hypothetical protein
LLCLAKTDITVQRDERRDVGFFVRLAVHFRANNIEFMDALHRTLLQYQIESNLKPEESKNRRHPILSVRKVDSLLKLVDLIPLLPDVLNQWDNFSQALEVVEYRGHLTQEGIEEIIELKEANK